MVSAVLNTKDTQIPFVQNVHVRTIRKIEVSRGGYGGRGWGVMNDGR